MERLSAMPFGLPKSKKSPWQRGAAWRPQGVFSTNTPKPQPTSTRGDLRSSASTGAAKGLSSRMLPDRLKGFVRNYDDYVQDLEDFFQKVVQPKAVRPIYLLAAFHGWACGPPLSASAAGRHRKGSPCGSHARHQHETVSTMAGERVGLAGPTIGSEEALVPGSDKRTNFDRPFEGNALTADPRRFAVEKNAVAQNPDWPSAA